MFFIIMLTEKEKEFAKEILELVEDKDLHSLVSTMTNNLEYTTKRKEAVKHIVNHTEDFSSLLSRKKLHKEVIIKYMMTKKINVTVSMDKTSLILKLVEYWKNELDKGAVVQSFNGTQHSNALTSQSNATVVSDASTARSSDIVSGTEHSSQLIDNSSNTVNADASSVSTADTELDVKLLAEKFTEWFYNLCNKCLTEDKVNGLKTDHLFSDCSLKMEMVSPSGNMEHEVNKDAEEVVRLLTNTQMEYQLFFQPNLLGKGVKGVQNVHGAVIVYACGTLHRLNDCCGIYEQKFLIVRDPFAQNNWKIKSMELKIKSETVQNLPVLNESLLSLPPVIT